MGLSEIEFPIVADGRLDLGFFFLLASSFDDAYSSISNDTYGDQDAGS